MMPMMMMLAEVSHEEEIIDKLKEAIDQYNAAKMGGYFG